MLSLDWDIYDRLQHIGVAHVGSDYRIIKCNACFASYFDQDALHMAGRSVIDITSPEDRDRARTNFDALASGASKHICHTKRYTRDSGATFSRMLETQSLDDKSLLSFVYEWDDGSQELRIQQLQTLLTEALTVIGGRGMTVTVNDNSQRVKNSGSGNISQTQGLSQTSLLAFFAMVALVMLGAMLYLMGGSASIQRGDTNIQLDSQVIDD